MTPKNIYPPVVVNCMPKSGTHLIQRLFKNLSFYRNMGFTLTQKTVLNREDSGSRYLMGTSNSKGMAAPEFDKLMENFVYNRYIIGHVPYTDETREFWEKKESKMIVLLRDPRDLACSFAFYFASKQDHYLFPYFSQLGSLEAQLNAVIQGVIPREENGSIAFKPLDEQLDIMMDWCQWKGCITVFFESLVGSKGGGSDEAQARTVNAILEHLEIKMDRAERDALISNLYSTDSPTFRKGLIGDWKNWFTPEIERVFNIKCSRAFERYTGLLGRNEANRIGYL